MIELHENYVFSTNFCNGALKLIMKSRNMKKQKKKQKIPTSNCLTLWALRSKPVLVINYWAILLILSFEVLILIFYAWVLDTIIEGAIKNIQFNKLLATTFRCLTIKTMVLVHRSTFSVYMTVLSPHHQNEFVFHILYAKYMNNF